MAAAPRVTVILPRMLADVLGEETLHVQASTVAEAMEAAYERLPALRHHLCDESGDFRVHVLCVHNGVATRETGHLRGRTKEGDEIRILQAISGG
jgi:sulfur-carrier protein